MNPNDTRIKTKCIVYHRKSTISWISILITGIFLSAISYALSQNRLLVAFILALFSIWAISSFLTSRSPIVKLDNFFLTICWGLLGASHRINIALDNIANVKLINSERKIPFGAALFFATGEIQEEVLQIELKTPPSAEAAFNLNRLRDTLFESDSFWVNKDNTIIRIRTSPKEGFPSLLASIKAHLE